MYQLTRKKKAINKKCQSMRDAKDRKRLALKKRDNFSLYDLPNKRKIVIVINFDFGLKIDIFRFYKTNRINSYLVSINRQVKEKMGWTVFCKRLSNHYPSLLSPLALDE